MLSHQGVYNPGVKKVFLINEPGLLKITNMCGDLVIWRFFDHGVSRMFLQSRKYSSFFYNRPV